MFHALVAVKLDDLFHRAVLQVQPVEIFPDKDIDSARARTILTEALAPNTLKEEYWSPENQLWLAQSGFGCSPTARGRSILCTCLGDGEQTRWNRNDFTGVLKDEYLPDWAKESLKQYQRPEQAEKQEMQFGGI